MAKKGHIKRVFPGGNTAYGFYSFYDYIAEPGANKIFVIKGGPGVGKSTFMRVIADALVARGLDLELHCCSSDNGSLDGVYVPAIDVALIDGTAPHVLDPKNPGAVDEIVHLGDYWNEEGMRANREEILASNREVGRLFRRAYGYLAAAKIFLEQLESYYTDMRALDIHGLNALADGLTEEIVGTRPRPEAKGRERHLFATAITPEGTWNYLDSVFGRCRKRYIITGAPGTGKTTIIGKIAAAAIQKGYNVEIFHCALDPKKVDHVLIGELSVGVINGSEPHNFLPHKGDRVVDTAPYVNGGAVEPFVGEMTDARQMYRRALEQAIWFISMAKKTHDKMETYYVPNMRFADINARRDQVLTRIIELANQAGALPAVSAATGGAAGGR